MTAHATLGASSAERWMTCPGSVPLSEGLPDNESPHAREGSAAHALAEHCLLTGELPMEYLGEPHPRDEFSDVLVTTDMVDAVSIYVDHVRKKVGGPITEDMVEVQVSLAPLGDWAEHMFGTSDLLWYDEKADVLHVDDYKHGQGVPVEVKGNPQLRYYGLGGLLKAALLTRKAALLTRSEKKDWTWSSGTKVRVTIIQPRCHHEDGPIRSVEYTVAELFSWMRDELEPAARRVHAGDESLVPSDKGCKFCKAKGICPALREKAMNDAMLDFADDGTVQPTVPLGGLTYAQIAQILDNEKAIKDWLAGVAALAQQSLERGHDITGGRYKLVAGRNSRDWTNEEAAAEKLRGMAFGDDDLFSRKFISPAQAEKLVGKKASAELTDLIVTTAGKPTLAPAEDKRPALQVGPEMDFAD